MDNPNLLLLNFGNVNTKLMNKPEQKIGCTMPQADDDFSTRINIGSLS